MANRKLAVLVIKLDQKVKTIHYFAVDSEYDKIPEEALKHAHPYEIKKIMQSEKKDLSQSDHGPLLIERIFQWAKNLTTQKQDKIGSLSEIRKRHLQLAFAKGYPEMYLKQYLLKGIGKITGS
jgi:hypothetical protein